MFFFTPFFLTKVVQETEVFVPIHKVVGSSVGVVGSSPDEFKEIFHKLDSDKI